METYTEPKDMVEDASFHAQKEQIIGNLSDILIDKPITDIIHGFNELTYCYTLQSCYGHFVYSGQEDSLNLESLPDTDTIASVNYRIAYIAFCIENSGSGRRLMDSLKKSTAIDPQSIQFCSAEWFWKRHVNSYVLQVEPERMKNKDEVTLDYKEALYIENIRNKFFVRLAELLQIKGMES